MLRTWGPNGSGHVFIVAFRHQWCPPGGSGNRLRQGYGGPLELWRRRRTPCKPVWSREWIIQLTQPDTPVRS